MSEIRITTLDNGLRVATDPMPSVETVTLGAWVGVGARNETAELNGLTHMVEHMLFKGTARRSAYAISEQIDNVGGQLNAYTTREHTAYYARALSDDLPLVIDIIADMLQDSVLDEQELSRERGVIIQEIGQALDTPDDIVFDHFQATAYPSQALGRPVLGSVETVQALPRGALIDYLGRYYGGPGMVLAAAGKVEHERLVALASTLFRGLPTASEVRLEPAAYTGGDYREDRDLEQVHFLLGFNSVGSHDPAFYAHAILSTLLGGGMSSRLFQEIRERRGLAYSVHSFTERYLDDGLFGVYAGTGPEDVAELVPVLCDELAKVAVDVSDDEVQRARAQLRAGILMARESTASRCEQLGQQLLIFGRPLSVAEVVEKVDAVDRTAVLAAARSLLQTSPTVTALGPIRHLEPYERILERLP